jgi:hypothetical protein
MMSGKLLDTGSKFSILAFSYCLCDLLDHTFFLCYHRGYYFFLLKKQELKIL